MNVRLPPGRRVALTVVLALLMTSGLARFVSASLDVGDTAPISGPPSLLCPPSEEVADLLRQIEARGRDLDAREDSIALREQDIRVAGQEIRASMARLDEARAALEARMYASDAAADEDVARLVTVYEGMKPREAAALFEAMESAFAAGFLSRMRPERAAAVLSRMDSDKAYALSAVIAGRNADAAREGDG